MLARPPASTRSHAFSVGLAAKVTLPPSELSAVPGLGWRTDSVSISSVQSLSRVLLCDPMDRSTPGLPVASKVYSNSCP